MCAVLQVSTEGQASAEHVEGTQEVDLYPANMSSRQPSNSSNIAIQGVVPEKAGVVEEDTFLKHHLCMHQAGSATAATFPKLRTMQNVGADAQVRL